MRSMTWVTKPSSAAGGRTPSSSGLPGRSEDQEGALLSILLRPVEIHLTFVTWVGQVMRECEL